MKRFVGLGVGVLIGAALGAGTVSELHAQAGTPVYFVVEANLQNPQAYVKKFASKIRSSAEAAGGHLVAVGGAVGPEANSLTALDGTPPSHVVIRRWESTSALMAWWHRYGDKMVQQVGKRYAKIRVFAVKAVNGGE